MASEIVVADEYRINKKALNQGKYTVTVIYESKMTLTYRGVVDPNKYCKKFSDRKDHGRIMELYIDGVIKWRHGGAKSFKETNLLK
jgi:hypothetical protein